MADENDTPNLAEDDIEMQGTAEEPLDVDEDDATALGTIPQTQDQPDADDDEVKPTSNPQTQFLEYPRSPIVNLNVGSGEDATTVAAHKAVLTQSPFFSEQLGDSTASQFDADDVAVLLCKTSNSGGVKIDPIADDREVIDDDG
ncbi:hypothetical protein LTR66_017014 [Elasticomyces elasticus]|nr:hypothetical protein LTR66_017014 [Elasticomyces elasticus]